MTFGAQYQMVCEKVGISFCPDRTGVDREVVRLAECVGMTVQDIINRPSAVASEITAYLDDLVRNP